MAYRVIKPSQIYNGRTYGSWVTDWFNWFLSADADTRNSGPVVFLRTVGVPNSVNKSKGLEDGDIENQYSDDPNFPKSYSNDPNVRIGAEKIQIYEDQAVLWPLIVATEIARKPYFDYGYMQDFTGLTIDYGDNPPDPDQYTINGDIIRPAIDIRDHRILTPIFTVVVPETEYGRSAKDFLQEAIPPSHYPALVEGYFLLVKFEPGNYLVHSFASAPRETRGPYFAELLYEIDVNARKITASPKRIKPQRNNAIITRIVSEKINNNELSVDEANKIMKGVRLKTVFKEKK